MREPKTHKLKTIATCWDAVKAGEKTFEVRVNDRFFQRGDIVELEKLNEHGSGCAMDPATDFRKPFTLRRTIGWMLQGGQFGIEPGYVVFQLEPVAQPSTKAGGAE